MLQYCSIYQLVHCLKITRSHHIHRLSYSQQFSTNTFASVSRVQPPTTPITTSMVVYVQESPSALGILTISHISSISVPRVQPLTMHPNDYIDCVTPRVTLGLCSRNTHYQSYQLWMTLVFLPPLPTVSMSAVRNSMTTLPLPIVW